MSDHQTSKVAREIEEAAWKLERSIQRGSDMTGWQVDDMGGLSRQQAVRRVRFIVQFEGRIPAVRNPQGHPYM